MKGSNPFDYCSQEYSRFRPEYPAALFDHIRSLWPPPRQPLVIDVGAGTGKASAPLVDRDVSTISVEPSLAMIAEGRRSYPKLKYVCATSEEIPIESNAADLVTAAQSFHWFNAPRALAEFARILKPRGYVCLFWNSRTSDSAASKLFDVNPDSSRLRLGQALDQAEQSLVEARLTIQSMRLPELENNTLPEALRAIAKRLTESTSVAFDLEVMGHVQQLPYDAQAGAYFICREAITNSVNHAGAKRIWAKLNYAARELRLIIQDDGCGFDPSAVIPKPGHVGLAGMRERAVKIGASLKIDSAPGQGSVVEVIIPRK